MNQYRFSDVIDTEESKLNYNKLWSEIATLEDLMKPYIKNKDWFTLDFEITNKQAVFLSQYSDLRLEYIEGELVIQCKLKQTKL